MTWRSTAEQTLDVYRAAIDRIRRMSVRPLTVSITTRNRPAAVERASALCVDPRFRSTARWSSTSVGSAAGCRAADTGGGRRGHSLEVLRHDVQIGTAPARIAIARRARAPFLLSLDDDAFLVGDGAVARRWRCCSGCARRRGGVRPVGRDGGACPPAAARRRAGRLLRAGFIGFGCLIARDRLLEIGGYREAFVIHGEEREVCLRWLDRGLNVVYLPDAPVAHLADASNRDPRAYIRHVIDDCLRRSQRPVPARRHGDPYKLWSFTRMPRPAGGDPGVPDACARS